MAKFSGYFGKNSNAPAKKIGDHIHSGLFLTPFGKKTKNVFWSKGNYQKKEYKVKYTGEFNPKEYYLEGQVNLIQVYCKNKIQQVWNVSYSVDYFASLNSSSNSNQEDVWKVYNAFISDHLYGGNDIISGGTGNDNLWGYPGNDKISGGSGNDILNGGNGDDLLVGGKGKDKLIGGKGKDIFKLSTGYGYDLIEDFEDKQDKIFIGSIKKLKLKNRGKDVLIYNGKDFLAKVKGAKDDLSFKGKYLA